MRRFKAFLSIFLASTIWPMLKQTYKEKKGEERKRRKAVILDLVGRFQKYIVKESYPEKVI